MFSHRLAMAVTERCATTSCHTVAPHANRGRSGRRNGRFSRTKERLRASWPCRRDRPSLTVVHSMVGETDQASHTEIRPLPRPGRMDPSHRRPIDANRRLQRPSTARIRKKTETKSQPQISETPERRLDPDYNTVASVKTIIDDAMRNLVPDWKPSVPPSPGAAAKQPPA